MVGVVAAAVVAVVLWQLKPAPLREKVPAGSAPQASAPAATASAPSPEPAVKFPLEQPAAGAQLTADNLAPVLVELLGRKSATSFLQLDDFPRRVVATVDNLGRPHAPSMLWPVNPTPGRFTVEERNGAPVIAADNDMRYTPLVLLVESVDVRRAVDLYTRIYPLLQRAYGELGYPKSYFNDRLIAVIDQLLATPDAQYPVQLQLTQVKGPIASERPWVRYQFADPKLEALSAGQKILLRAGSVNEHRLKSKLGEFRKELAARTAKR